MNLPATASKPGRFRVPLDRPAARRAAFLLLIASSVSLAGCGRGYDLGTLVPVTGKILVNGAPVPGTNLSFLAKDGTESSGGYAVTDEAGGFAASHPTGQPGLAPGTYQVVVSKYVLPDGSPVPEDATSAADLGAVEMFPPAYSDPGRSQLTLTVTDPPQPITFDLPVKGKVRTASR